MIGMKTKLLSKAKGWLALGIIPALIAGTYYVTSPGTDAGGAVVIFIGHYVLLTAIVHGLSKIFEGLQQ